MKKEVLVGSWINSCSPIVAEVMASCGFDFLTIDAEHSPVDFATTLQLLQAIRSGNPECKPFVRVPSSLYADVKRYMDAGAYGVICPLVNSSEIAEEVVAAVKYPPLGRRGLGYCRDNGYGLQINDRIVKSNSESFVCLQIEHIMGVENIESILDVKGIDAILIGPYDLSASMGLAGQLDHPECKKVQKRILDAAKRRGVMAGIHVVRPDLHELRDALQLGYRLVAFSLDITILSFMSKMCMTEVAKMMGEIDDSQP